MSLRNSLSPDRKIALIAAGWALVLAAEAALLYSLTPAPQPRPATAPLTVQDAATPTPLSPGAATAPPPVAPGQDVFTAPGVNPPAQNPATAPNDAGVSAPAMPAAPPRFAANPGANAPASASPLSNALAFAPPVSSAANAPAGGAAQVAFEAGATALRRGDKEAARAEFARAVQLAPDNLPSRLNLASLYLDAKQPAQAIPHLQVVAARDPKNAAVHFTLARALLADKKLDAATPELRRVIELAPAERAPRALLAQVLFDRKQPREAYAQWAALAQKDPKDVEAQIQAGALANDVLKQPDHAEKWLRRAVSAAPREPQPALMLGQLLLAQKDAKGAAAVLTRAAQARPDAFALYPALADARTAAGDLKGAANALQSALQKLPQGQTDAQRAQLRATEGALRLARGRALGQSRQTAAARAEFERAAKLLSRDPQPRSLAALAALQSKDAAGAISNLRVALQLDPKRAGDRKLLAQLLADQKKWREADAQFALYDAAHPGDAPTLAQWAQVAGQLKDSKREAQIWAKAARADPKNAEIWTRLALAQRAGGDQKAALASFTALSKLRPNDANARYEMAQLQSALGDHGAAYQNWKRVIAARPELAAGYPALLEAAKRAGQNDDARQFLVRALASQGENVAAIQGVLAFYERQNKPDQARDFLNDLVARDPKQKAARTALDALTKVAATPAPTVPKPMALDKPAQTTPPLIVQATSTPAPEAVADNARLTARPRIAAAVAAPTLPTPNLASATQPTKIARPNAKTHSPE